MKIKRRKTKVVKIGKLGIGGNNPISIQSMTKTKTSKIRETVKQIKRLEKDGCEIIRVAVKGEDDARAIKEIKKEISIPLEADIHFNYRLALLAIDSGSDAVRLNPGNIYRLQEIKEVVQAAKKKRISLRVGVNAGSLYRLSSTTPGRIRPNYRLPTAVKAMVNSALNYIRILEGLKFYDIIVSLKASDVLTTIEAYRWMAQLCDYPFHLGITATGLPFEGGIKSALGIGILLYEGIGDTIRVSLAGDSQEEVKVAKWILSGLGLRKFGPEIIACPTCGRAQIEVVKIAQRLEEELRFIDYRLRITKPLKIAIMGCEVNGPGEARNADIGIAGGKNSAVLFKKGKIVSKIEKHKIIPVLLQEIGKV